MLLLDVALVVGLVGFLCAIAAVAVACLELWQVTRGGSHE